MQIIAPENSSGLVFDVKRTGDVFNEPRLLYLWLTVPS